MFNLDSGSILLAIVSAVLALVLTLVGSRLSRRTSMYEMIVRRDSTGSTKADIDKLRTDVFEKLRDQFGGEESALREQLIHITKELENLQGDVTEKVISELKGLRQRTLKISREVRALDEDLGNEGQLRRDIHGALRDIVDDNELDNVMGQVVGIVNSHRAALDKLAELTGELEEAASSAVDKVGDFKQRMSQLETESEPLLLS